MYVRGGIVGGISPCPPIFSPLSRHSYKPSRISCHCSSHRRTSSKGQPEQSKERSDKPQSDPKDYPNRHSEHVSARRKEDTNPGIWRSLSHGIATVDAEVGTGDVAAGIGEEVGDGAHEVLGLTHLADWDQGGPVLVEFWVVVENLLGSGINC